MNNDSGGTQKIPLSLDIDTASLSQAQQAAERFEGTIEDLKRQLEALRQQFTKTFNQQTAGLGGAMQVPDYGSYKSAPAGQAGLFTSIVGATPQLSQLQARIAQLERQEATGAVTGSGPAAGPSPAGGPPSSTPPPGSQARPGHAPERPRPFSERLSENVQRARPLIVMGAFAHGDYAAGGRTIARAFLETMATDVRYARTLSRGVLGTAATSAATAVGGAGGGGAEGVMSAGAAGAAGAGEASLIGRLGAVLMGPIGALAAGLAVVAGAVVGVDTIRKQVAGQEYLLRGSVGGIGSSGDVADFQGRLDAVGYRYMYKAADTLKTADTLGAAGVTAGQMPGAVGNSMAFARTSGQDLSRVTALTSQLMVQGGMSATQVGAAYAQLQAAADQSGQSVAKLVTSLEDLLRTTGGGTQQINGLAAVQSLLGPAVGTAQVVGQPMMATGARAINTAGMLGISTERLQHIQETGNTAQMYDLVAATARKWAGGKTDQTTIDYVEADMQNAGLLDLTGTNPKNGTRVVGAMIRQGPRAAQEVQEKIQRDTTAQSAKAQELALWAAGARAAGNTATAFDYAAIAVDKLTQDMGLLHNNINIITGGSKLSKEGAKNQRDLAGAMGLPVRSRAGGGAHSVEGATGRTLATGQPEYVTAGPEVLAAYEKASQETGIPLSILLSQAAKESNLRAGTTAADGGMGIGQFMPNTVKSLLGIASTKGRNGAVVHNPFYRMRADFTRRSRALPGTFNPYDLDQAAQMQGFYDALNLNTVAGGNLGFALGAYNAGPGGMRSPAGYNYGTSILQAAGRTETNLNSTAQAAVAAAHPAPHPAGAAHPAAHTTTTAGGTQQVKVHLTGTLDVRDSKGNHLGTASIQPQTASIDPARTPVGHRPVAPRPVIPHAPLHDHNRR